MLIIIDLSDLEISPVTLQVQQYCYTFTPFLCAKLTTAAHMQEQITMWFQYIM